MDTKETNLNRRLAEWAGFTFNLVWYYPEGDPCLNLVLPNFTYSLDACFKWLAPADIESIHLSYESDGIHCWFYLKSTPGKKYESGKGVKEPALALCLAIIKLIEKDIDIPSK